MRHSTDCKDCQGLQTVATAVLDSGYIQLSDAFRLAFPGTTYHSHSAKRHLLQMAIAALRLGKPESGLSEVYLLEHSPGVNYCHLCNLMQTLLITTEAVASLKMSKDELKDILKLAQSDREREY